MLACYKPCSYCIAGMTKTPMALEPLKKPRRTLLSLLATPTKANPLGAFPFGNRYLTEIRSEVLPIEIKISHLTHFFNFKVSSIHTIEYVSHVYARACSYTSRERLHGMFQTL